MPRRVIGQAARSPDDPDDKLWRQLVEINGQMAVQIVEAPMEASARWARSGSERAALDDLMRKE